MNFKTVLRAYSLLRQLTDDESALLETLRTMNDSERGLLVETLSPQKQASKKSSSRSSTKGAKSKRASSLAEQIKTAGKPHLGDGPICTICAHTEDYEDHSKPSPHYHPFQPPASTAERSSSANGGAGSGTQNSETGKVAAGSVAQEASSNVDGKARA